MGNRDNSLARGHLPTDYLLRTSFSLPQLLKDVEYTHSIIDNTKMAIIAVLLCEQIVQELSPSALALNSNANKPSCPWG